MPKLIAYFVVRRLSLLGLAEWWVMELHSLDSSSSSRLKIFSVSSKAEIIKINSHLWHSEDLYNLISRTGYGENLETFKHMALLVY